MLKSSTRSPGSRANASEMGCSRVALKNGRHVDEVAQAVLMVLGNAFMTGQTVQVNGGTNFI